MMFLLMVQIITTTAQISQGGFPEMNDADFNASSVMYLLEPENNIVVEGLKSTGYNTYKKGLHYATERPVDLSPEFNGEWIEKDGMHIWRAHLVSPEAYSVGVLFSEFELNEGTRLFLYNPSGKFIKGGFTIENNKEFGSLYVGHIPGEEVIIELQVDDPGRQYGKLRIGSISHAFLPVFAEKQVDASTLGTSQDCEIDVNCVEGEEWQTLKRSVCHISTISLLCSGALVNNTAYNGEPYILTAEHCINKDFYAANSVFYFGYENSDCGLADGTKDQSVSGAHLMATGDSLDFSLVKLSSKPPREYDVYYAGWDAREQGHASTVTLHHPNADVMKISYDFDPTAEAVRLPGDLEDYILESNYRILEWDIGSTEGGSSGGPLFNSSKRIVGSLSGGLASCGDSIGYDAENDRVIYSLSKNRNDYFSKFHFNWNYYKESSKQLKSWLDPTNSGQLAIGGLTQKFVDVENKEAGDRSMIVYPNPSNGDFTLNLPYYSGNSAVIRIYDTIGRMVYNRSHHALYPVTITLPSVPSGIYLIRVTGDLMDMSGRIIISK